MQPARNQTGYISPLLFGGRGKSGDSHTVFIGKMSRITNDKDIIMSREG